MSKPDPLKTFLGHLARRTEGRLASEHIDADPGDVDIRYVGDPANGWVIRVPARCESEEEFDKQAQGLRSPQWDDPDVDPELLERLGDIPTPPTS